MNIKISIPGEFTDLNSYIAALNNNRYAGNEIKQIETNRVAWQCNNIPKMNNVRIEFDWYCPNKKKDKDNVAFGKKFILDGLVKAGVIPNDGWNNIDSFADYFHIDMENPRVDVYIEEVSDGTDKV